MKAQSVCRVVSHVEDADGTRYFKGDCIRVKLSDGTEVRGIITDFTAKGMYIYNGMKKDPFVHCVQITAIDIDHEAWVT